MLGLSNLEFTHCTDLIFGSILEEYYTALCRVAKSSAFYLVSVVKEFVILQWGS